MTPEEAKTFYERYKDDMNLLQDEQHEIFVENYQDIKQALLSYSFSTWVYRYCFGDTK
jgi:hypothetical protein